MSEPSKDRPMNVSLPCLQFLRAPLTSRWTIILTNYLPSPPKTSHIHMDVSKNSGTPKSSILIGFSIINHPFWVTPIFGNTHIIPETILCFFEKELRFQSSMNFSVCFLLDMHPTQTLQEFEKINRIPLCILGQSKYSKKFQRISYMGPHIGARTLLIAV